MVKITKRAVDALQPDKRRDVFTWDIELRGVNRRPKLTRFVTAANGSARPGEAGQGCAAGARADR